MAELDPFQAEIARIALEVAGAHRFALAGSNALAVHGIIARPTEDVDLFTDSSDGVELVAQRVAVALSRAGFTVSAVTASSDLSDAFEGFSQDMAEYEVSRDGRTAGLQLVRFDRHHSPVTMEIGPVLHVADVLGSKVAAMATRAEPRDYIDVANALRTYSRSDLVELAHEADPDLDDMEIADAMRRLDRLDDSVFTEQYRLPKTRVRRIRQAFSSWPR